MSKLLAKPTDKYPNDVVGRFERFYLSDNPFPAEPAINKEAADKRINGSIYESEIRSIEFNKIRSRFLVQPQSNANHLRLGYIIDTSYVGRGNGKSAFLVNLQQKINKDYCLDISEGINKCFAVYVTPEIGGRTKTFSSFVDVIFGHLLKTEIIAVALATLRLEALLKIDINYQELIKDLDDTALVNTLNDESWYKEHKIDINILSKTIFENEYLNSIPADFPLCVGNNYIFPLLVTQSDFENYYKNNLKKSQDKMEFLFSHLVLVFLAAGFNGSYILVDNFEQIAIPQSAKQKIDFAFELRACLYDGNYISSRLGFYNFFLTFHVGVQRLISEAWGASGMETRSPISSPTISNNMIQFEKLSGEHVALMLKKYLNEYRLKERNIDPLYPFKMDAINLIGQMSEFNASNILRTAYGLLEKISLKPEIQEIDAEFVLSATEYHQADSEKTVPTIAEAVTIDLLDEANR